MKAIALTSLILFLTAAYSDAFEVAPPLPRATASVVIEPTGHTDFPLPLAISCTSGIVARYNFSLLGLEEYSHRTARDPKFMSFLFQVDDEEARHLSLRAERYRGSIVLSTYEEASRPSSYPVEGIKQVQGGMEIQSLNGDVFLYSAKSLSAAFEYLGRKCEDLSFSSQLVKVETPSDLKKHNLMPLQFVSGGYYKFEDEENEDGEVILIFKEVGIGDWTSIERARSLTSLAKLINSMQPKVDIELALLTGGADRSAAGMTSSALTYSAKSETLVVEANDFHIGEDFYFLLQKYVKADVSWWLTFGKTEKLELEYNQFRKKYKRDPELLNDVVVQGLKMKEFNLSLDDAPTPFTYKLVLQDVRMALCDNYYSLCF
ncbi:hypothetical protein SAMN04488518_11383 [Pseudovibrio ascidiaceicola]|uniref:Uncharacterized protein n=1 Tax=Pseudovibrio ascidiaceicola TaxID=285279 RepID=A0A1I4E2N1_9HYPH|nr:hypothetical protein [Pseudovibrio ascidiaceicola]SFK98837.1 hypothetical protein SAMN04488518_11383 [Pseudovibrio ascidiaceicola]